MDFLDMFNEEMKKRLAQNTEYQALFAEKKAESDIYCNLAMQEEFVVKVKEAYFDGFETIGDAEYEFSQKLFERALKFVETWPAKKAKLEAKAQKTHFRGRKEKIESDIEYYEKEYRYYTHAFERRKNYQEHIAKNGVYDFRGTEKKMSDIETATGKAVMAQLSSTKEMAEFVEDRIMKGGTSYLSKGGKYDTLASRIVNEEIKKIEKEEKKKEVKPVVDKVLEASKKVLEALEDAPEQEI